MKAGRESNRIYAAFLISLVLLGFVFYQSRGLEGGLDSWNHFLISKSAFKHPDLLLDQWNKPVFTWCTVLICQMGINAMILFNICCVALSGLLNALAMKRKEFKHTWVIVPFTIFTPILFQNTISTLTEPLNVLMLALVFYFWSLEKYRTSLLLASFLPFVRTEGFVICGAILLNLILKKEYKITLWLIPGSIVMNLVGYIITGKPLWIITENPYWKQETEGTFDPGSGSIFHFIDQSGAMFGLPLLFLLIIAVIIIAYKRYKKQNLEPIVLISFFVFIFYFLAHTLIYYLGILGSHGLTRPMAVVAGPVAILAYFSAETLTKRLGRIAGNLFFVFLVMYVVWCAYGETGYAKPYRIHMATVQPDKTQKNFILAGEWLIQNGLMNRTIISQSPYFDVYFNKDPYDLNSSYRIWSIDQKNDWAQKGVIVIWDGFSAVREGNMQLNWIRNNPNYTLLHKIEAFEKPEEDLSRYEIWIFEKTGT